MRAKYFNEFVFESKFEDLAEEIKYLSSIDEDTLDEAILDEAFNENIYKTAQGLYTMFNTVKCWKEKVVEFVKAYKFSKTIENEILKILATKEFFGMEPTC